MRANHVCRAANGNDRFTLLRTTALLCQRFEPVTGIGNPRLV